jgi:asparagine synthase (glutamine-hydrolysing)
MCGLTGWWCWNGAPAEELCATVRVMADTLAHRGPDDSGVHMDAGAAFAVGFRRLSIIDVSDAGHQPMVSADGRFVIAYNGEVYNFRELRTELEQLGARFRGGSDTEVILEGIGRWGVGAAVRRLNGMFAFAFWDRERRELTLVRDRLGIKPLYYSLGRYGVLFGSELKALRRHPQFDTDLDPDAVQLFLQLSYVPAPLSIYRSARKLRAGHYAVFAAGRDPVVSCYWDLAEIATCAHEDKLALTPADAVAALDELLRDAVRSHLVADVPLGAFLSGGIDSSAVVAMMRAANTNRIRTFSIGVESGAYDEAPFAREVAAHLGTEHTEVYIDSREAQAVVPRLPDMYDEPFADSSQIPTHLVSSVARRQVTVALSGDGGDEIFGGYNRHVWFERIWNRSRVGRTRKIVARALGAVPEPAWDHVYQVVEPVVPSALRMRLAGDKAHKLGRLLAADTPEDAYARVVSHWTDPNALMSRRVAAPALSLTTPPSLGLTERLMLLDQLTYLPDDILAKVDRASMAVSLEVRVPLLDHRIVEWAWRLPVDFKRRERVGKWLLRQVLYRYVPEALVERPKSGFGIPLGSWLRGPLRPWVEELLSEKRLQQQGWLKPEPIRTAWQEHLSGRRDWQHRLWNVLMFGSWHERWAHAA